MKRILLKTMMSICAVFLFTGCIKHTVIFNEKYVESESIKYISNKNKKTEVNIVKESIKISKKPTSILMGRAVVLSLDNKLIEGVLEETLKQYFEKVVLIEKNEKKEKEIRIEPKLIDFDWEPTWGGQSSVFKIEIKLYKDNKEILNKVYKESYDKVKIIGTFLSDKELTNYLKSKDLFELYNKKVIPDLVKALKENQ
uniref:hypothetical protein n=1 Tax=Aliarcobacter sp. TaxID=2321116 RepID=UPI0040471E5A